MSDAGAVYARVAPPVPVPGLFHYEVPERLRADLVPGVRVRVPFGGRRLDAMVVALDREPPPAGVVVKSILSLVEKEPLVGQDILRLGEWLAERTGCSIGEALDATLPRAVKRGSSARTLEEARLLLPEDEARRAVDELQAKRSKQARTLRVLLDHGGVLASAQLQRLAHVSRSPLLSLARAGRIRLEAVVQTHDEFLQGVVARRESLPLTDEQGEAFARVVAAVDLAFAAGGGARLAPPTFLLHGVTGSGKTEIYLQVLAHVVAAGRQGIVLVPEISLTPQTVRRFRERFERVAVLHSHLTDAERTEQWRRIRRGEADVVVGARSAVFAPVPRLGLVVVDEEHETSFKQQNVPRYHAREVAIERARLSGGLVLLGTATPSLETYHRTLTGVYERVVLSERVAGGSPPEVSVVDLTVESRRKGGVFLSDRLRAAMEEAFAREGQVILFLNRRGWASVMLCRDCRAPLRCPGCEVSLTLHRRIGRVLCHYCGHEEPPPTICPTCQGRLSPLGFGTERVEQEVAAAFPGVRVARMDSDTMTGRGAHQNVLDAYERGEVSVLVGTQMIAKGLDFPNAVLVGVICADSALFVPDWRAAERTFQLLAQVTGRTGRGPKGGRVVVQAYDPRHPAIVAGVRQDYEAFARRELADREGLGYPPFGRLVRLVVQGPAPEPARARAAALGEALGRALAEAGLPELSAVQLLGPAPAPIPRINRQHRFHLVAKCKDDAGVEAVLAALAGKLAPSRRVRVLLDVDPVSML